LVKENTRIRGEEIDRIVSFALDISLIFGSTWRKCPDMQTYRAFLALKEVYRQPRAWTKPVVSLILKTRTYRSPTSLEEHLDEAINLFVQGKSPGKLWESP
jgi:hypothetical protein